MAKKLKETALITISKAGGMASENTLKYRAALPNLWMKDMGITREDRDVELFFNGKQIIIQRISDEIYSGYEKIGPIKIQISSSGGGAGSGTLRYNIAFLNRWMQELKITNDNRRMKRDFENGKIIFSIYSDKEG